MKGRKLENKSEQRDNPDGQRSTDNQPHSAQSSLLSPLPATYPFDDDGALCREFLLERGYCCGNGCRNCPYDEAQRLWPMLA